LLSTMRVGVIRGGCEVEIWKRAQRENKDISFVSDTAGQKISELLFHSFSMKPPLTYSAVRAGSQVTRIAEPVASADAA
jgi:stearoyl-CoA desaturase (delta-9 desaturase)